MCIRKEIKAHHNVCFNKNEFLLMDNEVGVREQEVSVFAKTNNRKSELSLIAYFAEPSTL